MKDRKHDCLSGWTKGFILELAGIQSWMEGGQVYWNWHLYLDIIQRTGVLQSLEELEVAG